MSESSDAFPFWAKSGMPDDPGLWLPLPVHLKDASDTAGWLWDSWFPEKLKNLISAGYNTDDGKHLYQYVAVTHDIGKISMPFWDRTYLNAPPYLRERILPIFKWTSSSDDDYNTHRHEMATEYFLRTQGKSDDWVNAPIALHHGRSLRVNPKATRRSDKILGGNCYIQHAETLYNSFLSQQIPNTSTLRRYPTDPVPNTAQYLLTMMLVMSDWLASNPENYPLIPLNQNPEPDTLNGVWGQDRTRYGVEQIHAILPRLYSPTKGLYSNQDLGQTMKVFFPHMTTPTRVQEALWDTVQTVEDPANIFVVEEEMGAGKTEAALLASLVLMERTQSAGIFFGLPTMATTNAMANRIEPFLQTLAAETDQQFSASLAHSKASFNSLFKFQKPGSGLVDASWLNMKHGKLMNSMVIGTIDQFLQLSLNRKHMLWRHLGLSTKVIILDEIHSTDTYMDRFLLQSLKWAGAYGCPVIALSATLNSKKRDQLIEAYNSGKHQQIKVLQE